MNTDVTTDQSRGRGAGLALTAALLGWMFDGLENGALSPGGSARTHRLAQPRSKCSQCGHAGGLVDRHDHGGVPVGAASGGVIFGWLGDRLGRVRAMTLSVITYALFSGLCGLANSATEVAVFRFIAALGMGANGHWALHLSMSFGRTNRVLCLPV